MKKIIAGILTISSISFYSCGGGDKKEDKKSDESKMGPVYEDTLDEILEEEEFDDFSITANDTIGISVAFAEFQKAILKRDTAKISKLIYLPMDISCLTSFNPKLEDKLEDLMITRSNWANFFSDLFSTKIVKLISHSTTGNFNYTRVSDGSVLCTLTIAEKKSADGEGTLGYIFTFISPSSFEFSAMSCAGGSVTDRDIISR